MHELSFCQALLDQTKVVAQTHSATEVNSVIVGVGVLSGVEPELLMQAFQFARVGTFAQYANLVVNILPVRVHCQSCGNDTDVLPNRLLCGECGDWRTQILSGDEVLLISVDLTTSDRGAKCAARADVM